MYSPIETLPNSSRIWIHQSNRALTSIEVETISEILKAFCSEWAAHGADLQTSFAVQHKRFVILAVNEGIAAASGCSIDGSTHAIKSIGQQLSVDFFDRSKIAFLENGAMAVFSISELKKLFVEGRLNGNSITFNMLAATLGEWREKSQTKVADSWLKRYIPKMSVA